MEQHERDLLQKTHDVTLENGVKLQSVLDRLEEGDARFKEQTRRIAFVESVCNNCEARRKSHSKIIGVVVAALSIPVAASLGEATTKVVKWLQGL